jgi:hypothetical protein
MKVWEVDSPACGGIEVPFSTAARVAVFASDILNGMVGVKAFGCNDGEKVGHCEFL